MYSWCMVDFYMAFEAVFQQYFYNIFDHFMTRDGIENPRKLLPNLLGTGFSRNTKLAPDYTQKQNLVCAAIDQKRFSEQIYLFTWPKICCLNRFCPLTQKTQGCRDVETMDKIGCNNRLVGQGTRLICSVDVFRSVTNQIFRWPNTDKIWYSRAPI
jgi:hypothetical protein